MRERWEVVRGGNFSDGHFLFSVRKSTVMQFETHLKVFLPQNSEESQADFEVKGNFFQREVRIYRGDQLIAEVKEKKKRKI